MKKEKSCGCIIFDNNKILLIKDTKGNWGFPKGHVEENETEEQTAIRETKEETNLDVEIDVNKRYVNHYITDKGIDKTVILFKAKKVGGNEMPQEGEVSKITWIKVKDAIDILTFDNTKELLKKVLEERRS